MPTHWHFVVWPCCDGELSRFFGYLSLTHATRWQAAHDAIGMGHVYQGRFKSFMIQEDQHLLTVLCYVERNPVRATIVKRAEDWRWSSLHVRLRGSENLRQLIAEWPIERPRNWTGRVNKPQTDAEVEAIQTSVRRGNPLGTDSWTQNMASRHSLQSTLRPRGRQQGWKGKSVG